MRTLLALAAVLLVLLTGIAPHTHDGALGRHACVACVASGAEPAASASPDAAPRSIVIEAVAAVAPAPPVTGAPLGAIPGQSPPVA